VEKVAASTHACAAVARQASGLGSHLARLATRGNRRLFVVQGYRMNISPGLAKPFRL